MQLSMLKSKIHRATVTDASVDYVGSITVDEDLLDAAEKRPVHEKTKAGLFRPAFIRVFKVVEDLSS